MIDYFKDRRRARLREKPFPPEWLEILEEQFPLYRRLPEVDQKELQGHMQVFITEKRFEGCGGLEMTEEIFVTIAAHACLLLLHRETDYFPGLYSILVYPYDVIVKSTTYMEDGVVHEGEGAILGESWSTGSVVLSWQAVQEGAADPDDGANVVFHEFAHQLDGEDGSVNGAPILGKGLRRTERRSRYVSWARVMKSEYDHLQFMEAHGRKALLDYYGATSPAEFFAVATEVFFERPREMQEEHPELYAEMKNYFQQDPAAWDRE